MKHHHPFFLLAVLPLLLLFTNLRSLLRIPIPGPDPDGIRIKVPEGFISEHLYSPSENKRGSWVSMCFDDKGRLIVSDQFGGLYRFPVPGKGEAFDTSKVERIMLEGDTLQFGAAHGLLYAFNSLYVMVNNRSGKSLPKSSGFFRLMDRDGDDQFDTLMLLKNLEGSGEHGPHSIKLAPDGQSLYVICGNYTDLPAMDHYRLPPTWQYDNLLPEIKDPRGHANDRKEPGGWVARVDPEGKSWELISAGYRNPFDLAFNDIGDLFVYDADMEWDFGLPWYRPTRICHAVSGSEFGWRTGNGKWSADYPDNLPPVIAIGQGSPTNLMYLKEAHFPARYRQALLAFDWSFGIVHAIHLKPEGSSYKATREEFLSAAPLPLTDGVIGPDGALYFLTGGRRLESHLFRVHYAGSESTDAFEATPLTELNSLRRKIETYHSKDPDPSAVNTVWPYLGHQDRGIRYAARIALEHQPLSLWKNRALEEKDPIARTQALIGYIRMATPEDADAVHAALLAIDYTSLNVPQQLDVLRAMELSFTRLGMPRASKKKALSNLLDQQYPANRDDLNRALCRLLVFLEAPTVQPKTLDLMANKQVGLGQELAISSEELILRNPQYGLDIARMLEKMPQPQQTYLAIMLAGARKNWDRLLRDRYFAWFPEAFSYRGGNSYIGFLDKARNIALKNAAGWKKKHYDALSGGGLLTDSGNDLQREDYPKGPGKNYQLKDIDTLFTDELHSRNFQTGKSMYVATTCSHCHAMRGEGGNIGPDLTQIGTRFSTRDIMEAIILPSKTISDQYATTEFQLKNGKTTVGKITAEDEENFYIAQNPYLADVLVKVPKRNVISKNLSSVSSMLPGLVNPLNAEELKDLMAYLKAGGDENHPVFKGK